ncbi:MAG: glycosyl hydrolase family 18 protein [Firmicutes bacterium]|nr:glycosyl hydrolase family 18 protein [Bacillota bacterium]
MKRKVLHLLVTLAAFLALCLEANMSGTLAMAAAVPTNGPTGAPYTDIAGNFAAADILTLTDEGYIHGFADQTFRPNLPVTRGQFLAYLMTLIEPTTGVTPQSDGPQHYADVPPGNWAFASVASAYAAGWIQADWIGAEPGQDFHENDQASRGDAAAFFVAALEHQKNPLILPRGVSPLTYADELGWFAGIPEAASTTYLTRADAAVVLANMQAYLEKRAHPLVPAASPVLLGWNYGSNLSAYLQQDAADSPLNTFVYDGFHLNAAGTFVNSLSPSYAKDLQAEGKQAWGLFGNTNNPSWTHTALLTRASRLQLSETVAAICESDGLNGANVDFENVDASDREDLSLFVQTLTSVMHQIGKEVSVDVAPPSAGSWSAAYDYRALASAADQLVVMTYDEHWSGDPMPGPVTSVPWVQGNLTALLRTVPADKLVLGMPLYTRAWDVADPSAGSYGIPLIDMTSLLAKAVSSSEDARFSQSLVVYAGPASADYEFWRDGPTVLQSIGKLAANDHLDGLAFWRLGFESPSQWSRILPPGLQGSR